MKRLLVLLVLFAALAACLAYYRGWLRLSTDDSDRDPGVTTTVDRDKIRGDEERVKKSAREIGNRTGKAADDPPPPESRNEGP